ncbi:hypothetical protein GCM10009759_48550 [Kitasatospora saccharophila]|uniref:Uncharacterized protein n=1 Tax=Kitasatospora saccharophila TaxID=407973 RepID=A0ABN2XCA9_9ACTN
MVEAGRREADVLGAVLTCGPVVLVDGLLLASAGPLVLLPLVPVLIGAAIGAGTAPLGASTSVRLYRAGLGALIAHLLLLLLLLVLLQLYPPRIPW